MNYIKKRSKSLMTTGAVAVLLGISSSLRAAPIVGDIGFNGEFSQNGGTMGDLTTATSMSIINPSIGSSNGSFDGATLVSFASIIGVNPGVGLTGLWQVKVGSVNYTFTSTSEVQDFASETHLHLEGTGLISNGNPVDDTTGTWQLGFGVSGQSFEWQSTSAVDENLAGVPEAGPTASLVAAGLCLLGFFRKKALARRA